MSSLSGDSGATDSSVAVESIRVLHVDDDPSLGEVASTFLEKEHDAIEVVTTTSAEEGFEILMEEEIDCVVSDYDMPRTDGLEFLRTIRKESPDLPFILFTGKGSEEIASEAVSAGVTDYLQKETSPDQYTVLANRIENIVTQYRAERKVEQTQQYYRKLIEHSTDVISIVDAKGCFQYLTPSAERILGYEPDELIGEVGFDFVHPDDRAEAIAQFNHAIENPELIPTVEFQFDHPERGWIWLENHARNMVDDPVIEGFVVHTREITERKHHKQELERQNDRLEEFVSTVSHDLRNPLSIAMAKLRLFEDTGDRDYLADVKQANERMERIIEDLLTLAREGETVDDPESVSISRVAEDAWKNVVTESATLQVDESDGGHVVADPSRLQQLFENLFRNAVDHGGDTATISVGILADDAGFYVADDGPGIPDDEREQVFESGYSTTDAGTGFGLSIVEEIVDAHGWEISVTESEDDGARFEIMEVEFE